MGEHSLSTPAAELNDHEIGTLVYYGRQPPIPS